MSFVYIFIILFVAELLYFKIANRYNIIDKPNERSSHTKITLRGGGIIFYIAAIIYFIYSRFSYPYFFVGLTLISAISFLDDIKPQSSKLRLIIHFLSILLMLYQLNVFAQSWYIWIIGLVFCVGVINAFNFMDGINGITGGYSFVIVLSLIYVNSKIVYFVDSNLLIILLLSIFVFSIFNFRKKAKCFAGDVGAISIAFILIFLIGKLILQTLDFTYIILLIVYGVDTAMTILHRILLKESLTQAHRKHLYQIMSNELKIPHLLVSVIYMGVQALIILGYIFTNNHYLYLICSIIVLCVTYLLFMKKYFYLHQK